MYVDFFLSFGFQLLRFRLEFPVGWDPYLLFIAHDFSPFHFLRPSHLLFQSGF